MGEKERSLAGWMKARFNCAVADRPVSSLDFSKRFRFVFEVGSSFVAR